MNIPIIALAGGLTLWFVVMFLQWVHREFAAEDGWICVALALLIFFAAGVLIGRAM